MADERERLMFQMGFDLESAAKDVINDWPTYAKRIQKAIDSTPMMLRIIADDKHIGESTTRMASSIKSIEQKLPQLKLKVPDTVDFEQEIERLKVSLKDVDLGALTKEEQTDLYLYIRQLEAASKQLRELNKAKQLSDKSHKALREASAEQKRADALAKSALAEQRSAKIATERARQSEINTRNANNEAIAVERKRKATASAELAELRLANAQKKGAEATKAQNTEYHKQSSYISRLIQRLGIYTSIYAAAGMLRDIRETTAEFEIQEVALGAIIQDAHEAQVLFSQIKAAAVESPYQIKELVDYTKQLAAYGFEQNELFDTTMKLADISAGLGADMSRIILAVGQVSAATVLKGTELRQFTELGIPMVELLAKKFTQLRGEVVTTGEVFEMISDKAVSFKMVEEILNDLTSAGGMFYDMQRKQAETLAGQWSNLKDSIAIAYDEIGNTGTVRGAMEGWISTVKSLVENWRIVGSVIGGVVSSFAGVKLAALFIPRLVVDTQMLAKAINDSALAQQRYNAAQAGSFAQKSARWARLQAVYMRKAAFATTAFSRSWYKLAASMAGGGWISIAVTAITVLVSWFISARKEANRLNEEINRIGSESELQADQSVRNFERLANAAANAADGTKEQADALAELHRSYRDVIPVQDMTIDKLREMQGEYKSLTDAIKEKIAMQAKEQKISTIISELGGDISDRESDVRGFLKDSGLSSAEVSAVMDEIKTAVDEGLIDTEADVTEQARQIEKIIFDTTGRVVDVVRRAYVQVAGTNQRVLQFRSTKLSRNILKLIGLYTNLNEKLKDVEESADKATGKMGDYGKMFETLQTSLSDVVGEGEQYSFEWNESILRQKVALYKSTIEDILGNEKINYKIGDNIDFAEIGKSISSATPQLKNAIAEIEKEYNKLVPTDRMSKVIKDKFMEVAESTGASMDALQGYLKNADTSVTDWAKSIEEAVSSTEKKLNEMTFTNRQIEAGLGGPLRPYDEQEIDSTTNKLTALKTILEWISSFLTTKKTTPPDNRLRDLNEEVSLLEKVYAKYKEFVKYMSSTEAEAKTRDYFADTIDSLRFGAAFDTTKLKEILMKYQDAARSLPESDKTVLELGFKVDDVSWQETLDDMKERVAELAEAVSRSKEAKDFYDKMLGMTGDRQLSADLTMSVYGGVGDDLKENIKNQLVQAFKGVDITKYINGKNIDYKKLEGLIGKLPEDAQANARKLVEDGQKANAKIIEDLYGTLIKFEDYEDKRMTILRNGIEQRRKIEELEISKSKKRRLKDASQNEESKALAKLDYEQFKSSDMYITMFENLDYVSTDTLKKMKEKLLDLKSTMGESLDPNQIKEIVTKMEDIDAELSRKNPFKTLAESIRTYKDEYGKVRRKELESDLLSASKEQETAKADVDAKQQAVLAQEEIVRLAEEKYGKDSMQAKVQQDILRMAKADLGLAERNLKKKDETLDNLNDQARAWRNIKKAIQEAIEGENGIVDTLNMIQSMADSIKSLGEGMGAGDQFSGWMEAISGIVGGAGSTATGIGQILSGQWAQGLANVVKGLSDVALGIFDASYVNRVAAANAEIERQAVILEDLDRAYQQLEKSAEDAFGTEYLDNYQDRLTKLYAMQAAYQAQADAERDKGKKEDEQATKDYEAQAQEVADQIAEMYGEISERLTGTDLGSAARDFANAWLEAYKSFGNTSDAIGQKFREMIENMVAESVIAGVMKTALKPVFDMIDKMTKDDLYDPNFWQNLQGKIDTATERADVGATNAIKMLESMGLNIREMGSNLSGISKDIATASEESILGLAAGINTQNFYISQIHAAVLRMEMLMQSGAGGGVNIQDLVTIQNQHLAHLPNIAANTANTLAECRSILAEVRRVADNMDRVITPIGTSSTHQVHTTLS